MKIMFAVFGILMAAQSALVLSGASGVCPPALITAAVCMCAVLVVAVLGKIKEEE